MGQAILARYFFVVYKYSLICMSCLHHCACVTFPLQREFMHAIYSVCKAESKNARCGKCKVIFICCERR